SVGREVERVVGELYECPLQRSVLGGQFENGQVGLPGGGADLLRGQALHVQDAGLVTGHGDVWSEQQLAHPGRLRGAHRDRAAPGARHQLLPRGVGDQPPAADHHPPPPRAPASSPSSPTGWEHENPVALPAARPLGRARTPTPPPGPGRLPGSPNPTPRGSPSTPGAIPSRCPTPGENPPTLLPATSLS